jgi:hypothetical protein
VSASSGATSLANTTTVEATSLGVHDPGVAQLLEFSAEKKAKGSKRL